MGSLPRARLHLMPSWDTQARAILYNWSLVWAADLFTAENRWEVAFVTARLAYLLRKLGPPCFAWDAEGKITSPYFEVEAEDTEIQVEKQ